jgi:hypothetical protein
LILEEKALSLPFDFQTIEIIMVIPVALIRMDAPLGSIQFWKRKEEGWLSGLKHRS